MAKADRDNRVLERLREEARRLRESPEFQKQAAEFQKQAALSRELRRRLSQPQAGPPPRPRHAGGRHSKITEAQEADIKRRLRVGEKKIAEAVHVEGGARVETLRTRVRSLRKELRREKG